MEGVCIYIFQNLWSLGNRKSQTQSQSPFQSQSHFPVMPSARLPGLFIYAHISEPFALLFFRFLNEISRVACRQNKECINYPSPLGVCLKISAFEWLEPGFIAPYQPKSRQSRTNRAGIYIYTCIYKCNCRRVGINWQSGISNDFTAMRRFLMPSLHLLSLQFFEGQGRADGYSGHS